jgi:3-oxoacyl-[acyl-carrier-protein] synthase-3
MRLHVGILGLGVYLPADIRRNDWWPAETVARWMSGRRPAGATPTSIVETAMAEQARDPFQGAVERRVMPAEMSSTDMEEHAARAAFADAGIDPQTIDLVLLHTLAPDWLATNTACVLHHRLGLRRDCFTLQIEAAQHSFPMQLSLANAMIASGQAKRALLVQSCPSSKLLDYSMPLSAAFGDGASAVIVGAVSEGRGMLGSSRFTDGTHPRMLIASVPGGRWYDDGRAMLHLADPIAAREILTSTVELASGAITAALADAGLAASDVTVSSIHQGQPWLQRLVCEAAGITHARSIDVHARTGHLFAALIPSNLHAAVDAKLLAADDVVVIAGGGNGMTYGASVLRWGT